MALGAGAAIALQASLNAKLGVLLDSALAATVIAFAVALRLPGLPFSTTLKHE